MDTVLQLTRLTNGLPRNDPFPAHCCDDNSLALRMSSALVGCRLACNFHWFLKPLILTPNSSSHFFFEGASEPCSVAIPVNKPTATMPCQSQLQVCWTVPAAGQKFNNLISRCYWLPCFVSKPSFNAIETILPRPPSELLIGTSSELSKFMSEEVWLVAHPSFVSTPCLT